MYGTTAEYNPTTLYQAVGKPLNKTMIGSTLPFVNVLESHMTLSQTSHGFSMLHIERKQVPQPSHWEELKSINASGFQKANASY